MNTEIPPATPEESTPSGADLVVPPNGEPHDVLEVLDRHDEQLIVEEFQRRAMAVMLYDFTQEGRAMIDLSYSGVREAISLMNRTGKVRIGIVGGPEALQVVEHNEDHSGQDDEVPPTFIEATVWARDEVTGQTYSGTSVEPKFLKTKRGKVKWDKFARTKAINKAERNALKKFIPEPMRQTMIAQYRKDDEAIRTIKAGAGAEELAKLPPPLDDDEAKALRAESERLWREYRDAGGPKPSGWFHGMMTAGQHSHEMMADFRDRLAKMVEEEKA